MALINSKNISRIAKRRDNGGYGIGERKTFYITYFEYDISDESGQIRGAASSLLWKKERGLYGVPAYIRGQRICV